MVSITLRTGVLHQAASIRPRETVTYGDGASGSTFGRWAARLLLVGAIAVEARRHAPTTILCLRAPESREKGTLVLGFETRPRYVHRRRGR